MLPLSSSAVLVDRESEERENYIANIKVDSDSNILIGQYGINLQSLQHIIRLIIRKEIEDKINLIIDVNSYREQKNESIVELARQAAKQAIEEKKAMVLKPMSAYERRLVHLELAKNDQVTTESIGEDENRKIVIKPANMV